MFLALPLNPLKKVPRCWLSPRVHQTPPTHPLPSLTSTLSTHLASSAIRIYLRASPPALLSRQCDRGFNALARCPARRICNHPGLTRHLAYRSRAPVSDCHSTGARHIFPCSISAVDKRRTPAEKLRQRYTSHHRALLIPGEVAHSTKPNIPSKPLNIYGAFPRCFLSTVSPRSSV